MVRVSERGRQGKGDLCHGSGRRNANGLVQVVAKKRIKIALRANKTARGVALVKSGGFCRGGETDRKRRVGYKFTDLYALFFQALYGERKGLVPRT